MQRTLSIFLAGTILLVSTACAGRGPLPIQINQAGDRDLTCDQIKGEILSNQTRISGYQIEKDDVMSYNVMIGIAGLFLLGIPWFFLDLRTTSAAGREEAAVRQRDARLQQMAYEIPNCRL